MSLTFLLPFQIYLYLQILSFEISLLSAFSLVLGVLLLPLASFTVCYTHIRPIQRNRRSHNDAIKNTKVRSPNGNIDYFDIVAGVLQGDILALYLFIICLDYVLKTSIDKMKDNGFKLTKERSRRYPTQTITDADYDNDIAILANTPTQAESLLDSLERAAGGVGLRVNALIKQATFLH